jgi:hypothetical protein
MMSVIDVPPPETRVGYNSRPGTAGVSTIP